MNLEWVKNVPDEFLDFVDRLLPLPLIVRKYRKKVRILELEILTLSNALLEKGLVSKKDLEKNKEKVMEMKREEYASQDVIDMEMMKILDIDDEKIIKNRDEKDILNDKEKEKRIIRIESDINEKNKKQNEIVEKSSRMPPIPKK